MRVFRGSLLAFCLAGTIDCSGASLSRRVALLPRRPVQSMHPQIIPRGGGGVAISLDQATVAKVALSYLLAHCLLDVVKPSTAVKVYGLDTSQEINSFYFSRLGGWSLTAVGSLALQQFAKIPFNKAIGYSFLPITLLTLYQLLSGGYVKAGVNPNSGIVAIFFQTVHCALTLAGGKIPPSVVKYWIQTFMLLTGLSGANLVISAQTIPGISRSTLAILRMLGTVSCYVATTILSQQIRSFDALQAFGVLMGTLAVTSIPVCMDLHAASSSMSKVSKSVQLYIVYVLLEIGVATYMFR